LNLDFYANSGFSQIFITGLCISAQAAGCLSGALKLVGQCNNKKRSIRSFYHLLKESIDQEKPTGIGYILEEAWALVADAGW